MIDPTHAKDGQLLSSGVPGIDDILHGGLPAGCVYLVSGEPGSGKTTLAMQFLLQGVRAGERCLYVTLSESRREIEKVAVSHRWDLSNITIKELVPSEQNLSADQQLTVFHPSEVELGADHRGDDHRRRAASAAPRRGRFPFGAALVAQNPLRYRRQILALKQFFSGRECTVLMLDDCTGNVADGQD